MTKALNQIVLAPHRFAGDGGIQLMADVAGDPHGIPVLMLHGGGQTRHSWGNAARVLAEKGYYAVTLDLRGHGESDWSPNSDYSLDRFGNDAAAVARQMPSLPVMVGASLGGMSSMIAIGDAKTPIARGLVLVDVTPKVELAGAQRIADFMRARPEGFASLDEVADAVASYVPTRPRPTDTAGLLKNVRERDGRYFWHWDPAFMRRSSTNLGTELGLKRLEESARHVKVPTLLVRGSQSEVVSEATVDHMMELIPHAEYVDILGAGHMVAGDKNDAFNAAIFDFLARHKWTQ